MRMTGFIGPTYAVATVNVECQRAVNLYLQIDEAMTGANGEKGALIATPGTRLLCAVEPAGTTPPPEER